MRIGTLLLEALLAAGGFFLLVAGQVSAAPPGADNAGFAHIIYPPLGINIYCPPDQSDVNGVCFRTAGDRVSIFLNDAVPSENSGFVDNPVPIVEGVVKVVENGVPAGP